MGNISPIPCWNLGSSSHCLLQTYLHKVLAVSERSRRALLTWVLYRYTLYLPLLQKSPVQKQIEKINRCNRLGKLSVNRKEHIQVYCDVKFKVSNYLDVGVID